MITQQKGQHSKCCWLFDLFSLILRVIPQTHILRHLLTLPVHIYVDCFRLLIANDLFLNISNTSYLIHTELSWVAVTDVGHVCIFENIYLQPMTDAWKCQQCFKELSILSENEIRHILRTFALVSEFLSDVWQSGRSVISDGGKTKCRGAGETQTYHYHHWSEYYVYSSYSHCHTM